MSLGQLALAIGLCVGTLAATARGDDPLQPKLDNERIQARLQDRLVLPGQGRGEKQEDLQVSQVPKPVVQPRESVRARADSATLREQKTKRVAASQN